MENDACIKKTMEDVEDKMKLGQEKMKQIASVVDQKLRENPWPIVTGVAIGCVLLGFMMGANKKN